MSFSSKGLRLSHYVVRASATPYARPYSSSTTRTTQKKSSIPPSSSASSLDLKRTASAREAQLRAARLRRKDLAIEGDKKKEEKRKWDERYKGMARKWTSGMIAMPVLLVTSWYLFDRLVMGNEAKIMPKIEKDE